LQLTTGLDDSIFERSSDRHRNDRSPTRRQHGMQQDQKSGTIHSVAKHDPPAIYTVRPAGPPKWIAYFTDATPTRLVVFVHGFDGKPLETWLRFPDGASTRPWWRESDLLFVGYDSTNGTIKGFADNLRHEIPAFYPARRRDLLEADGAKVCEPTDYAELVIVGHSLGGVVARRAVCDAIRVSQEGTSVSPLATATVRLFSPATAGFRPAGKLGMLFETKVLRKVAMIKLRRSQAFTELERTSPLLDDTRTTTEALAHDDPSSSPLHPRTLWAFDDEVVEARDYKTDPISDSIEKVSHSSVCKPKSAYIAPWDYVETGDYR
jgi:pimeloyl-ACP methyl ester carboxylesterase